jgi:hypothetical protein
MVIGGSGFSATLCSGRLALLTGGVKNKKRPQLSPDRAAEHHHQFSTSQIMPNNRQLLAS